MKNRILLLVFIVLLDPEKYVYVLILNLQIPRDCDLVNAIWSIPLREERSLLKKGSLIVFNVKSIHAASENLTDVPRLSLDRRYTFELK